jgi:large subunit ribosomal protein L24
MPAPATPAKTDGWSWPSEPFIDTPFPNAAGKIALKARQVDLLPHVAAREFKATLTLDQGAFALDDVTANVAGGRLTGRLGFRAAPDGLKLQSKFALTGADAAALFASGARPSVSGKMGLSADVEGSGLSPVALIGSLKGSGAVTLADAQFAGLNPRAFDAVTRAVDQGVPIDNARIADIVRRALESGQLSVKQGQGTFAINAGQVRLGSVTADSNDATVSLSGNLDLIDGSIDARLVLSGAGDAAGARPDIFMALGGQLTAPARTIDVSALTGWLTLRSVENQAKRLRAIEHAAPKPETPVPAAAGTAPPPSATPLAVPTVDPASQSQQAKERVPALPPPLDVRPYPGPPRAVRPEASVGPQN